MSCIPSKNGIKSNMSICSPLKVPITYKYMQDTFAKKKNYPLIDFVTYLEL